MEKIPFIDIADTNVWIVYLIPFAPSERSDYDKINEFQQKCIANKVFGMGWADCSIGIQYGTRINEGDAARYKDEYISKNSSPVSNSSVSDYLKIKKGDYVIMRLKNSHYYVGRVSSDGAYYMCKSGDEIYSRLSWGCSVERWEEYANDSDAPSEIVGRFSQRLHSTIQKVSAYRQKLLVIAMYENKCDNTKITVPKVCVTRDNFVDSLTYMQLEDLVSLYIMEKHEKDGYILLPSTCKVSQQKFEYMYVAKGKRPITCQVKNKEEIKINHYEKEESYEKIYLFSGKWNDDKVKELNEKHRRHAHIYIISPSELYKTLRRKSYLFNNKFYDFENNYIKPSSLKLKGYTEKKRIKDKYDYVMDQENDDWICFLAKNSFFYSAEFGALILSSHVLKNIDEEKQCIERLHKDINLAADKF